MNLVLRLFNLGSDQFSSGSRQTVIWCRKKVVFLFGVYYLVYLTYYKQNSIEILFLLQSTLVLIHDNSCKIFLLS